MSSLLPRAQRVLTSTGFLLAFGLGLRLYRYLRNPSMWHDEAALVLNVLGKSFPDLLGPLFFAEAAPPGFLWVEKAVCLLLGDSTYALRLVPFLAGCVALILLVPIARKLLTPAAVPWAVFLFACSDQLLWHVSEAKSYSVDVLAAALLAYLFVSLRSWSLARQLVLHAAMAPAVIFLVYPGCFLYGGLLMAMLPSLWRSRRLVDWLAYGVLALAVAGCFGLLLTGPIQAQRCTTMEQCWTDGFPPFEQPWRVPLWVLVSSLDVVRYCSEPAGAVLAVLVGIGALMWWRRRQRAALAVLAVPVGLAFIASFGKAYPFGGSRVLVYAAPAVLLLMAEGAAGTLDWLRTRNRLAAVGLAAACLTPVGAVIVDAVVPGRADCAGASAYVLARCRPGERITSNAWECLYYFRNQYPDFVPLQEMPCPAEDRVWLVFSGDTLERRHEVPSQIFPGNWRVIRQREFTRTTVFLLERTASAPQLAATRR